MVTIFRFSTKSTCILACALALCVGCNDDDKKGGSSSNESLTLTSFHPTRHSTLITGSIKRRSSCKGKVSVTLPRCGFILIREKHL